MANLEKHNVLNKRGVEVRMNDAALRMAEKYFGVNRIKPVIRQVPTEVLNLPKRIDIIKAVEVKTVSPPVEEPKPVVEKVVEPEAQQKRVVRKPIRKKK